MSGLACSQQLSFRGSALSKHKPIYHDKCPPMSVRYRGKSYWPSVDHLVLSVASTFKSSAMPSLTFIKPFSDFMRPLAWRSISPWTEA
jgi:hypothetical protein